MSDSITAIENELDRHAMRLQALAAEPSPWCVEGMAFSTWERASKARGELTELLLHKIDTLNHQRLALMGVRDAA